MLKLSRENKSAPAPIHARSNDSPCTRADFPAKKRSCFDDQKVYVIAALFINSVVISWRLFISWKRSDHDYFGETELCTENEQK